MKGRHWAYLNFCVRGAERLVYGGGRRSRRTTDAVGKSVLILRTRLREAIVIKNRKLTHRFIPVLGRPRERPEDIDVWRVLHNQRDIPAWMQASEA